MKKFLLRIGLLMPVLLLSAFAASAQFKVSGMVKDAGSGEALPGATVALKGGGAGTSTDLNGNFSLNAPGRSATLVVSYTGYNASERAVDANSGMVEIMLTEGASKLEEIVVTGLSTNIKRANAANSVARLSAQDLTGSTRPATLDGAMSGKIIGANIVANGGAPGGGISVKLRGVSSITGSSEPLYVVDGIITNNAQFNTGAGTGAFNGATAATSGTQDQATNRISDLNPADIESIDILKGPAAAAIYGTRANAGVIVITTKRGKAGKTQIRLTQDLGMSQATNLLEAEDWTEDKIRKFGGYPGEKDVEKAIATFKAANGKTVDYNKEMFGNTGFLSNTNISVSGGTDKTKFFLSGSVNHETGLVRNTQFDRRSIRANIDHRINSWLDVKINSNYLNTYNNRNFLGNDNNGVSLGYTLAYIPNFLDIRQQADGTYPLFDYAGQNPLEIIDKGVNEERTNRFLQSGELNIKLFNREKSSLRLSFKGGLDYLNSQPQVYLSERLPFFSNLSSQPPGSSRYSKNQALFTYVQSFLTYDWSVGAVNLTTTLGALRNDLNTDESWVQGRGLIPGVRNPRQASIVNFEQTFTKAQDVAVDLSQSFNWADKIILTAGFRSDRSSLNADVNKLFFFPRANIAINLTNFDFLADNAVFSQLKPRFAFGRTGGVPNYGDRFTTLTGVNYGGRLGLVPNVNYGNRVIEPETAQEVEMGLDFGLFKNRVSVQASYYIKTVFNFLAPYTLSPGTGVVNILRYQVGDLENQGLELGIDAQIVKNKDITISTGLNYWFNRSEVTRLNIPPSNTGVSFGAFGRNRLEVGKSPTLWWGLDAKGQLASFAESQPDFQLGWNTNVEAKGFSFNMLWHTSQGNHLSSLTRQLTDEGGTTVDWSKDDDNDGIVNGQDERLSGNPGNSTGDYILDASYIRLRELSLYYSLPRNFVSRMAKGGVSNIRIGVSGQNLVTFADIMKYTYDPESSNFGNRPLGFVDLTPFPQAKRMFFHLAFEF